LQAHRVLTTTSFALLCLSFLRITNLPCATQTLTRSLFLHINGIFENFTRVTKILQTYKMSNFAQKPRHDLLVHQESNSRTYLERIRIGFARGYEFKRCAACAQEQDLHQHNYERRWWVAVILPSCSASPSSPLQSTPSPCLICPCRICRNPSA
jgi:hypothetical protein